MAVRQAVRQARLLPTTAPAAKLSKRKPRTKAEKRRKALKQPPEAPQILPNNFLLQHDRETAKSDKQAHRESLNWLMQDKTFNSNMLDQRDLVCTGMAAVRKSCDNPSVWENSFRATNTKPSEMIPFADWIKKIELHLTASDSYKLIQNYGEVDKHSLLPPFWQAMEPEKKRLAVDIVKKHEGNAWGAECIKELMSALSVLITELPALQTCIFCAMDDPSHLS